MAALLWLLIKKTRSEKESKKQAHVSPVFSIKIRQCRQQTVDKYELSTSQKSSGSGVKSCCITLLQRKT
jgi:hypothetical protein